MTTLSSCIVNVKIPDPELFDTSILQNNSLNSARMEISLPYSYQGGSGNIILNDNSATKKYLQFSRLWANVEHEINDTSSTDSSYEFKVMSKVSAVNDAALYPISVTPTLKYPIDGATFSACIVTNDQDSCINTISLPKDKFIAGEKLQVTFKTSSDSLHTTKDAIISEYSVGDTIIAMRNQDELVAAFNSLAFKNSTSGKLFILENDIALTERWTPVQELRNAVIDGQGHKITNLQIECAERSQPCGMFKSLYGKVIIKNLSLQGKVILGTIKRTGDIGLLAGRTDPNEKSNVEIYNSNFNSEIKGNITIGGVIGNYNGHGTFESITIFSKIDIEGQGDVGAFSGSMEKNGNVAFKNIRIKSIFRNIDNIDFSQDFGGLIGYLYNISGTSVENIILDIQVDHPSAVNFYGLSAGGLFGKINDSVRSLNISKVDVNFRASGFNNAVYGLLGRSRNPNDVAALGVKLSDIISRGRISTSADPQVAANRIAGITIPELGGFTLSNLVDMSIISYNGQNYVSPLVGKHPTLNSPGSHIYYVLPEGATYIAELNSKWLVEPLTGDTVAAQKDFLERQGFDFTNTWTIKEIDGIQTIGIKEDLIPQFPTW